MMHLNSRRTYGSGHLHGLSAPGLNLEIALEPDALHRETQRRLSLNTGDHTQVTDSLGREERYHFVGGGPGQRWTAHTRADGSRIEFRYDRAGRKIATVDPLGRETLIERDDHGQVITQTGPDGTRWAIERDALGQPVSIEGPDDQRWQITRNDLSHPLEVTGPEGTTAFAYDNTDLPNRPTTVTDAVGATHQREWNALGQITTQIDCYQQRTEYAFDRHGYLASVTNATPWGKPPAPSTTRWVGDSPPSYLTGSTGTTMWMLLGVW